MKTPTPEGRSRAFWSWFASKHPARGIREIEIPGMSPEMLEESRAALEGDSISKSGWDRDRAVRGFALTGSGKRRTPSASARREALERQRGICLYCDNPFGAIVRRKTKLVTLQLNWDHFIPFSYGLTNAGDNWVAACHVCNGIKSNRMFETVSRARTFIRLRWLEKGYDITPVLTIEQIRRGGTR